MNVETEALPLTDAPLPLAELDLALTPLRRVIHWAAAEPERVDGVRYLESTSSRWLERARALAVPQAIRELIDGLQTDLEGYDDAERSDRLQRVASLRRSIRRIDAILGLPLSHEAPARVQREVPRKADEPKGAPPRDGAERKRSNRPRSSSPPVVWDGAMDTAIVDLPGISAATAQTLEAAGLLRVRDLLFLRPTRYHTLTPVQGAGRAIDAGEVALSGRVSRRWTTLSADGARQAWIVLVGAGPVVVQCRQGTYLEPLALGTKATFVGAWDPETRVLSEAEWVAPPAHGKVHLPRYDVDGVDDVALRAIVVRLLPQLPAVVDPIPLGVAAKAGLIGLRDALLQLHTGVSTDQARRRLGFQEAVFAHLGLAWSRYHGGRDRPIPVGVLHGLAGRLVSRTEFSLTDEQLIALEDLKRDLLGPRPMCRVLTGEVGVGKGAVALQMAVTVAENKGQVLMLSPDAAGAALRFGFAAPLLREAGLVGRLVEGEVSDAMRDALSRGEVHLLFGSLELLEQKIEFRRLGLVVAEESGPWGYTLPAVRRLPTPRPHALVLTSTPVGSAISLAAYPTAEWTVLASGARKRVGVQVHASKDRKSVYALAAEATEQGRQVVVAFPLINGQDALTLRDALSVVHALEGEHFVGRRVGLFHGSMTQDERRRAFSDFRERRLDVLVATTSIEDAPPVPNVSMVVVEQAARVDLGRLQRIGGYVASSIHDPEALLVVDEPSSTFEERFSYVEEASDGYVINDSLVAEDLQSHVTHAFNPLPVFSYLTLGGDRELLWQARHFAHRILHTDPDLRQGWYADMGRWTRSWWTRLWPGLQDTWPCPIQDSVSSKKRRRRRRRKR